MGWVWSHNLPVTSLIVQLASLTQPNCGATLVQGMALECLLLALFSLMIAHTPQGTKRDSIITSTPNTLTRLSMNAMNLNVDIQPTQREASDYIEIEAT